MNQSVRVRFAPSPTGPLHIGGVRTALYNYLFARKYNGTFCLRIEDTDQKRFVCGAEAYIIEALNWLGISPDEGPEQGGNYAPYRQSERQHIYEEHVHRLVATGKAYYAFDTPEELEQQRTAAAGSGQHNFKYDCFTRLKMKNSLTLPMSEVERRFAKGEPWVVRLNVPQDEELKVNDLVRGTVLFQSNELDDKVLMKADGMPTYHLANVVDDRLMQISHVIRGEEWLPSTGHHVLLYRAFGWEDRLPQFAHLPLILKPDGKGKLNKRDGAQLGIPVLPLTWRENDSISMGFREFGFLPEAVINFLTFLGWNPGTGEELFSLNELCREFSPEKIHKGGARFDMDKARWFNHQHIQHRSDRELAALVLPTIEEHGHHPDEDYLAAVCALMKERCQVLTDFWDKGKWFFEEVEAYDLANVAKRWDDHIKEHVSQIAALIATAPVFEATALETTVKEYIQAHALKMGQVLPLMRIALSGNMQGPGVFETVEVLGPERATDRLRSAVAVFEKSTL